MQQVMYANGKLWGALDTALNPDGGAQRAGIAWYIVNPNVEQARPPGLSRRDRLRLHLSGDRRDRERPRRDGLHGDRRHAQPERGLRGDRREGRRRRLEHRPRRRRVPPRTTASRATSRRSATRRAPAGATTARPPSTATRSGSPASTSPTPATTRRGAGRSSRAAPATTCSARAPAPPVGSAPGQRSATGRLGSAS